MQVEIKYMEFVPGTLQAVGKRFCVTTVNEEYLKNAEMRTLNIALEKELGHTSFKILSYKVL
mgnify:CR=1 FL=1